jgi:hypothetical protein
MNETQVLARIYLDAQQFRIASKSRIDKLTEECTEFNDVATEMKALEKHIIALTKQKTANHLLWKFAENVKGLGDVGVLTFLGYLDPYIADTSGKAKAYLGLTPNHGLQKGLNHKCNFEAKGRFYGVVLNGVIMAKDKFYYQYYLRMKAYYSLIPKYADEIKQFQAEYKKKHPKAKTKINGTRHVDAMAKRATLSLLVSHGLQIMRENEGLDTSAFLSHHNYIAPPNWIS